MGELLDASGKVAFYLALFGVIAWALSLVFGSQVFGLPAMLAAFVIVAGGTVYKTAGVRGLVAMVIGLVVLMLVIGMAMSLGPEKPPGAEEERPVDDLWP